MKRTLSFLVAMLLASATALATDRYYPDRKGQSPNGRYAADAKSPQNEEGKLPSPFERDFTVTFRDTQTGKSLWKWKQGATEETPVELIPANNGHLIMLDAWDDYHVFGADGIRAHVFNILQSLPEDESEKFTEWTTAGVFWRQHSQQGFLTHQKRLYFYIRLYWGRTYIVDIVNAKLETDVTIAKRVEKHIVEQVQQLIKEFDGEYYAKCDSCDGKHLRSDLTEAVFVIKKHGLRDGRRLLDGIQSRMEDGQNSDLQRYLDRVGGPTPWFTIVWVISGLSGIALVVAIFLKRKPVSNYAIGD